MERGSSDKKVPASLSLETKVSIASIVVTLVSILVSLVGIAITLVR
jgi:hypothetical protein